MMTVIQAARFAHVSSATIYRLVKQGHLASVKDGEGTIQITSSDDEMMTALREFAPMSGYGQNLPRSQRSRHRAGIREMWTVPQIAATVKQPPANVYFWINSNKDVRKITTGVNRFIIHDADAQRCIAYFSTRTVDAEPVRLPAVATAPTAVVSAIASGVLTRVEQKLETLEQKIDGVTELMIRLSKAWGV